MGDCDWVDSPPAPEDADQPASRLIGPYRTLRRLGKGGMGTVYLADRVDASYQKRVAIKVVKRGMDTPEVLERFRLERQTLASLDHPNIARLLDGGTTDEGMPYLVMDYVEGLPIDRYCAEHRLTLNARIKIFRDVCAAVECAHQNLVVHRDLKPDNILVSPDGVAKLVDFGIATVQSGPVPDRAVLADDAAWPMTLRYASPEQVRGRTVTTASDIYSLGVLLYELLTGVLPRSPGSSQEETVRAICEESPVPPSFAIARNPEAPVGRRELKGDLDAIVLRALSKEPSQRYASVGQLSADLQRFLRGLPVAAEQNTLGYRTQKFLRRHRIGAVAAALVVALLVAGTAIASWQARVAAAERDKADRINAFLQEILSSSRSPDDARAVTVAEVLSDARRRVDRELVDQPEVQASLRTTIGMTYLGLGLYDAAEAPLKAAYDTRRRLFGDNHPDVAASVDNLGQLAASRGDVKTAEPLYRQALDTARRAIGPETLETAAIQDHLGEMLLTAGRYEEAEQLHRRTLALRRKLLGEVHADVAVSLNNLSVVLGTLGRFSEAEPLQREALAVVLKVRGPQHPDVAAALSSLASVLSDQGKFAEAEPLYRQSLDLKTRLLGSEHPDVTWTQYNYAFALYQKSNFASAIELSRQILTLRGKTLPDSHPMVAGTLVLLGRSLMGAGNPTDAVSPLTESLELRRRTLPPGHWLISASESVLGECLGRLGRIREAEPLLVHGYETIRDRLGEQHERTREAAQRLKDFYQRAGRPDKAAALH